MKIGMYHYNGCTHYEWEVRPDKQVRLPMDKEMREWCQQQFGEPGNYGIYFAMNAWSCFFFHKESDAMMFYLRFQNGD